MNDLQSLGDSVGEMLAEFKQHPERIPPILRSTPPSMPAVLPKSWEDLLAIDPTLSAIDDLLADQRPKVTEFNQWRIYSLCKRQVSRRVGHFAVHAPEALCNHVAYNIAIRHVTDALGV